MPRDTQTPCRTSNAVVSGPPPLARMLRTGTCFADETVDRPLTLKRVPQ